MLLVKIFKELGVSGFFRFYVIGWSLFFISYFSGVKMFEDKDVLGR